MTLKVKTMPDSTPSLQSAWNAKLAAGEIMSDPSQAIAVAALQNFADQLAHAPPAHLFERRKKWRTGQAPQGFYLYGSVGRGKSMLMDMFFATTPIVKKRRVHFHAFMLEIHERLHRLQQNHVDEILPDLAQELAKETKLLCFDEFHVSNIADAMILGRLFSALFDAGVIIIATSNWPPDELYKNGLQRDRFLPFIELIKERMVVHNLQGVLDHRYEQMRGLPICFTPLGDETTRKLQGIFFQLTGDAVPEPVMLQVQGRTLRITHAAKGVGFFNFDELCGQKLSAQPMGAGDYLAIAECLHTILIDGVPRMEAEKRDESLRFMTLIDALYEAKTKLFMAAAAMPEKLAPEGEHEFAFQRTVSRLAEMSSEEYRRQAHLG
jgi:cell division protein ZapE